MYVYFRFRATCWLSSQCMSRRPTFWAWSVYFAVFENNNATFYNNPLCAVDDDLLLLPVLSVIVKMYNYRRLCCAQSFSIHNVQKISRVKFTSVLHIWRTMSVVAKPDISMAAKTWNNYISGTMTDSVEIPTPNLGFSMMTSSIL